MVPGPRSSDYFVFAFPLSADAWDRYAVDGLLPPGLAAAPADPAWEIRRLAERLLKERPDGPPAEILLALRTLNQALRFVAVRYFQTDNPGSLERGRRWAARRLGPDGVDGVLGTFVDLFPPLDVRAGRSDPAAFLLNHPGSLAGSDLATVELLLLFLNVGNPAAAPAHPLFADDELRQRVSYVPFVTILEAYLAEQEAPGSEGVSLMHLLRAPLLASPDSLFGQLAYIREHWAHLLPDDLLRSLQLALDVLREIDLHRAGAPGPAPVLEFGPGHAGWQDGRPEPEAFSQDAGWMRNVVLMAKSVHVWLDQLSRQHGRPLTRLDEIPDQELDRLATWGVNGLWLIGLWERSDASRLIKQYMGNPEAAASAYALHDYRIADELGGEDAWRDLSERAGRRGIRLASDMVPNHMGIDSTWVVEHPEYFLQLPQPPYPAYRFTGGDLCGAPGVGVRIEEGYWNRSDAAVVFQRMDENTGQARYIYHGNDGTSMPWNDTAQLDFLRADVREAVIQVILDVARRFPIIRFDAAMTLAKKHYQRLWFPAPGDAGAIPSRAEHGMTREQFDAAMPHEFWREVVDRVAQEAPDTLLLAEAFWLMEGYFVRTLGMHRVYNSAFMNMLKLEDNAKYRQTLKNVLEFSPAVLQRFVNFMNNPDERTAIEQFGKGDKYFGCMLLMVTLPGLPMIGHGQIEGYTEKYGMEYRRAYWDEKPDEDLVRRHERDIFPVMRHRGIFSGAEHFALFDFETDGGWVDENVFAYANRGPEGKALIIYNNGIERTNGRMRLSSAINTGSAEQPFLVRRSLAEALDLDTSPGAWHLFRDHLDGREYVRSGEELAANGLHTPLNGYQARALVDWRLVRDNDGSWARVAAMLRGGGTPDLGRARRRLQLEGELAEVRGWLSPAVLSWLEAAAIPVHAMPVDEAQPKASRAAKVTPATPAPPVKPVKPVEPVETDEPAALRDLPRGLADRARALHALPARLATLTTDPSLGPRTRDDLATWLQALPGSRALEVVWLGAILRCVGCPGQDRGLPRCAVPPADVDLVAEDLAIVLRDWSGHEYQSSRDARLASAIALGDDAARAFGDGRADWVAAALANPAMAQAAGVNTHDGTRWLGKENLEALVQALVVEALVREPQAPAASSPAGAARHLTALLDARDLILGAAAQAGYKVDDIVRTLAGPGAPPA
jgi:glycosidase